MIPAPFDYVRAGSTDEILAALGRSPAEIAALRAARVVASEPVAWG